MDSRLLGNDELDGRGMVVGDVGLLVCGGWVIILFWLLGFGSAMEDAGWTLPLFLSRQLVGVLGSGEHLPPAIAMPPTYRVRACTPHRPRAIASFLVPS